MKQDIKDIVEEVSERTKGLCERCYSSGEHYHHSVSGKGKRTQLQTQYSVYLLCEPCHRLIHNDRLEDLRLKFETQNRYMDLELEVEEVRRLMGDRIYIKADIERVFEVRSEPIDERVVADVERGLR